jgi:plasmid stabilization system protein ParE
MISEVVYTETYKITLTAVIDNIEKAYGTRSAEKLLDRIDRIVEKIIINPYLYQAIPVDTPFRRAVISRQSSLVYEVTDTKIILLYIFDNRQEPFWI